jgi:uncharacterized protein YbbC (DUF1343 family)/CubicO group peptidase (beta-lactamase class C family)
MRVLFLSVCLLQLNPAHAGLPSADPSSVGLDPARLARIDAVIDRSIAEKQFPGAVVLVGRDGKIAFVKTYGHRALVPDAELLTRDTMFDMASLTKPIATATSAMVLLEQGKIRLEDPIIRHLPEFDSNGKRAVTVEHLLRHRGGFIPDNPLRDYLDGPAEAWHRLERIGLQSSPGEKFAYSDVGFEILGRLVERVAGQPLDRFARENIFEPLGMADTGFLPSKEKLNRLAPTERDQGTMLRGVVHDPRSRALGGVAGHAGLFSTADDVAVFAQMLLDGGKGGDGRRVLSPLTVRRMIDAADTPDRQRRGLGWDVDTGYSGPRGSLFGESSFGHTGFTGTSLWVDPESRTFVVILTSRLHPDGKGNPARARAEVATIVASSIVDVPIRAEVAKHPAKASTPVEPAIRPVLCGIDVLARDGFKGLKGRRVGLVTNHTGRTLAGESTIDLLFRAPDVKLVALFSPEHGIRGLVDTAVADARDEKTGLPIFSLYGKTRKPTPEILGGVDVLVYDIQDIGARFYTYISTLGLLLEAAAEAKLPVIVLDRPNPIGGTVVSGPVRDPDFASFIAYHALPVRHGMTVGELARLFNAERSIHAQLTVIPCEGWRRGDLYDRSGLLWINPSPNMRSLTEALLYPGIGLLEASNIATGRGTDEPFERVGAPWIDPRAFARALNELALPGVRFVPIRFTPRERQYANTECGGVQIIIIDRVAFDPLDTGIGMAVVLRRLYRDAWKPAGFLRMLADRDSYARLLEGEGLPSIRASWQDELDTFRRVRQEYLIYP